MIKNCLKFILITLAFSVFASTTLAVEPFTAKLKFDEHDRATLRWPAVAGAVKYCINYDTVTVALPQCTDQSDVDFPLHIKFGSNKIGPTDKFTVTAMDKDNKPIAGGSATSTVGSNGVVTAKTEFGNFADLGDYAAQIMQYALPLGIGLALIMTIYAGIQYMLSQGQPDKIKDAQEILQGAVLGLTVLIISRFLVNFLFVPTTDLSVTRGADQKPAVEEPKK